MRHAIRGTVLLALIVLTSAAGQPLQAQSRQEQVGAELARSKDGSIQACSLLTKEEVKEVTALNDPYRLNDEPYGQGALCDYYSGLVTLRIFSGKKPEDEVDWVLANYKIQGEKQAISGFGSGAYIMFPQPRDQYQDTFALLVGRAGQHMFMITVAASDGESAQSVQPQAEKVAKMVIARMR